MRSRDVAIVILLVLLPTLVAFIIHTATTPADDPCDLAAWNQRQADIAWENGDPDHDIYRDLADVNDRKCQR